MNYQDTIDYWNEVFSNVQEYDIAKPISFEQIENALKWLCKDSTSILDFGCGHGKILFRCLGLGVKKIYGIDISSAAISFAKKIKMKYNLDNCQFMCGSFNELYDFSDCQFDAVILFNIIDNLIPSDGLKVLKHIHRLTKGESKILIKLNDYIPENEISNSQVFNLKEKSFYKEKSGLFSWNLSNQDFKKIISPYFKIINYEEVDFKRHDVKNRIYYLTKVATSHGEKGEN